MSACRHFYSPRGCQYNPCRFSHDSPPQTDGIMSSNPGVFSSTHSIAPRPHLPFPPGTCKFYYNLGHCTHGERCKYKHVLPETSAQNGSLGPASPFPSNSAQPSPAISATDALRRIATYCSPGFSFTKPIQMVPFVKLLISAEPKKGIWVSILAAAAQWHHTCLHLLCP